MRAATRELVDLIFTRLLALRAGATRDSLCPGQPAQRLPPNAMQFRDLCRRVPPRPLNGLEGPKPDPVLAAASRERIGQFIATAGGAGRGATSRLQWAVDLRKRDRDGELLSAFQRSAYREALGLTVDTGR